MKNFGLLVLGILLGALAMYFYCYYNQLDMETGPPMVSPNGIISSNDASTLDKAYNLKHSIINDSLFKKSTNGGDNRSSWWSIEDIQNYINHAEHQSGQLGYTLNGLRVYLGSYPDANGETGLTTMFIVPTGTKDKSKGSFMSFQNVGYDIPGADVLNKSENGKPPGANYPQ